MKPSRKPSLARQLSLLVHLSWSGIIKGSSQGGGRGGGAVAGSYTRRGNPWDLVVLNPWNLNVDESYHRDCPVDREAYTKHGNTGTGTVSFHNRSSEGYR